MRRGVHAAQAGALAGALAASLTLAARATRRPRPDDPPQAHRPAAAGRAPLRSAPGSHLGFDVRRYPGDSTMRRWRRPGSPFEWVGYYLEAPCRTDHSWVGTRAQLARQGWGTAVLYVGQQAWLHVGPHDRTRARATTGASPGGGACSPALLTAARGRADADEAIRGARADGFPRGTVLFLDVERMDSVPRPMRDYYGAWFGRVLADGAYRPGVYVHALNAAVVHDDLRTAFAAAGVAETPRVWVAAPRGFTSGQPPRASGFPFATVWQAILERTERWQGVSLTVDVNVANRPSPSAPDAQATSEAQAPSEARAPSAAATAGRASGQPPAPHTPHRAPNSAAANGRAPAHPHAPHP